MNFREFILEIHFIMVFENSHYTTFFFFFFLRILFLKYHFRNLVIQILENLFQKFQKVSRTYITKIFFQTIKYHFKILRECTKKLWIGRSKSLLLFSKFTVLKMTILKLTVLPFRRCHISNCYNNRYLINVILKK